MKRPNAVSPHEVLCVILGGGRGTRLFPLTKDRAKPAVPIGGKYRLIDIPISNCIHAGLNQIFVLTQYNSASLNRHIAQTYKFDAFSSGFVDILAAEQTYEYEGWYLGTADAVRRNLRHFQPLPHRHFLILSGDQLYRLDLRDFVERHQALQADVSVALKFVPPELASELGIAVIDEESRIVQFAEKPPPERLPPLAVPATMVPPELATDHPWFLASMGIYIFNRPVLFELLTGTSFVDFGKEILPYAVAHYRVFGYLFSGYWVDIGNIRSFYEANIALTGLDPPFSFFDPERPIYTRQRHLPPSRVLRSEVVDSLIAEGCIIEGARIRRSVIGIRGVIREDTDLEAVLMMGADFYESPADAEAAQRRGEPPLGIGPDAVIRRAIIDKNVRIGRSVRLVNTQGLRNTDGNFYYIRDGIIVIPKNAVVPDGTVL
ncbi:MAG: glucose-1-phosphate adenylyltransferase [Acidobacteria bacterium]|nr:glucose-1-phosphate adenylyltransferase [Acidobacteriota bacterium]MDW7984739.1 glucose-1-phosphate adenylyltransferase [Acidobacteriota bacterium]